MNPAITLGIVAIIVILAGLLMCFLSSSVKGPLLQKVVYITGIVLVVIGLILLLTPVLVWINNQIRAAFNL